MAVKKKFWKLNSKNGEIGRLNLANQLQCTAEFDVFFVSIVFIIAENMSCIYIKQ